jgi:cytochrome c553
VRALSWPPRHAGQAAKPVLPAGFHPDATPQLCAACHGPDGIAVIEDAPHLAGENTIYLQTQLKAFRSGARQHEVMTEISQSLTDDEIVQLSNWFASVGIEIADPE